MKPATPKIAILLIACLFGSTNWGFAESARYTKIENLTNRIELLGISLLPPQENGWSYIRNHPARITFGKSGAQDGQSVMGGVVLSKLPDVGSEEEFLEVVSKQRHRDKGNPRYEDILDEQTISHEKNTLGVRIHTKYKDFGAKNMPGGSSYLVVEDIGIMCRHPENKNVAVSIILSQRSRPEDTITNFQALAEGFIKDAEFMPFPKTPDAIQ